MSKNSIMLLYRYINKEILPNNRNLFRTAIIEKIQNFNNLNSLGRENKIKEWDQFIKNYIQMKYHINRENKILESYNINVVRDSKKEIENVARKVGLEI